MMLRAAITGNLVRALDGEVVKVAAALKRAVATTGQQVQAELRAQARGAGFKDGGRSVANAWRLNVYPRQGIGTRTLRPAALVSSRMPEVVDAFDSGKTIMARGGKYMAFPTGYNASRGRRGAGSRGGVRVTTQQMIQAGERGEAFVLRTSNPNASLWCLRVAAAYTRKKRLRLFVGTSTEVVTGKVKGLQAMRGNVLKQGFVPMFFLMRRVTPRKRLNVEQVRARAPGMFAANARRELNALG
jgi:hypothetical protein